MTRDIAIKFNEQYGQTFVIPEPQIRDEVAVVPGTDGHKMSKSYGNTIEIFGNEKAIRKKIMGTQMDSREVFDPKPDADQNLVIKLFKLLDPTEGANQEILLKAGGYGYGSLKQAFFNYYWSYFADKRKKRAELAADLPSVNRVLAEGATKARTLAQTVLKRARKNCGLE
jgi:tryptophanyl-tRNA synthetase